MTRQAPVIASFSVTEQVLAETDAESGFFEEHLERGSFLVFPPNLLPLPPENDQEFLREKLSENLANKNISYHPEGDYLTGLKADRAMRRRTRAILKAHHRETKALVSRLFPHYAARMSCGKVNARPLEEQGRALSVRASNERVHVDSLASGATGGDRILRFFTNIHPSQIRIWKSGGLFPDLFEEFAEEAGLSGLSPGSLNPGPGLKLFSGTLKLLSRLGFPQPEMALNNTPYDRKMRKFHNFLKENNRFQEDEARFACIEFPPFYSWAVLTDMVSHAVISGRHALVNTFHIRLSDCRRPDLAPYHILTA